MRRLITPDPRYPAAIGWALGLLGSATLIFALIHAITTFDDLTTPFLSTIMASPYQSPVTTVPVWPIWAAAFFLLLFQSTFVYRACRWPWHNQTLLDCIGWSNVSGILFYAYMANIFDYIDPYDRARVVQYLSLPGAIFLPLAAPFLLTPFLLRRRADVALIPQAIFFAAGLFPCIANLIQACIITIQSNALPGWGELRIDLFFAYTALCAGPFLVTCAGLSWLITHNNLLTPDPDPAFKSCPKCAYNLTGSKNRSHCPECGNPIPA